MTTDELRDWHARRAGWNAPGTELVLADGIVFSADAWTRRTSDGNYEYKWHGDGGTGFRGVSKSRHPFPATLDGADASFPPRWRWTRDWNMKSAWWSAFPEPWDGVAHPSVPDTGDKIHDLYELSKLAWEQEAAR